MIVLDTNVISEATRLSPDPKVRAWLDDRVADLLYLTTTTLAELQVGVEILRPGARKDQLASIVTELRSIAFAGRILPFDERAAIAFAQLFARARSRGRTIHVSECQIAAIAAVHGFSVATRDTAPFAAAGVPVINPWENG
jgi:predicted nucleic acid-binding protein